MKVRLILALSFFILLCACEFKDASYAHASYDCENDLLVISENHPDNQKFENLMHTYRAKALPGVSILINTPQGIWIGADGYADLSENIPFKTCSLVPIGSITKTLVGALSVKLQQEGIVNLDDNAALYVDENLVSKIKNLESTTIRQLLNHTSGIYNYTDTISYRLDLLGNMNNPDSNPTIHERLKYVHDVDALFPAGKGHYYSNTNYLIVDLVLENITGKTLEQLFDEYMFEPLSMNNSYYTMKETYIAGQVQGYFESHDDGKIRNNTFAEGGGRTAHGGVVSNIFDLHIFLEAIRDEKIGYLSEQSVAETQDWVPYAYNNINEEIKYGLGLGMKKTDLGDVIFHTGRLPTGYNADMRYYKEQQVTVIFLTNIFSTSATVVGVINDYFNEFERVFMQNIVSSSSV